MTGKVDKPWGYEEIIFTTDVNTEGEYNTLAVKKIVINAEEMTSFHYHKKTNEVLYVNKGTIEIRMNDSMKEVGEGEAYYVEKEISHQIQNITDDVVEIIEVAYPFSSDEDELVRVEDPYEERR